MKFKVGDYVRTLVPDDSDGNTLFPVGTVGKITFIQKDNPENTYKVEALNDFWWYREDMLELESEGVDGAGYKTGYADGLNDGWELARKVVYEYTTAQLVGIFGRSYFTPKAILDGYIGEEAKLTIEKWEKRIKVGDVAKIRSGSLVLVTYIKNGEAMYLKTDGDFGICNVTDLENTGRSLNEELGGLIYSIIEREETE